MYLGINRKSECSRARNGFNWNRDKATAFMLALKLGPLMFGFRQRSKWLLSNGTNMPKYIWFWGCRRMGVGIPDLDFDTRTVKFGKNSIAVEIVEDACEYVIQNWREQTKTSKF